jgi:NAD(P)H-dependent FMN reductase
VRHLGVIVGSTRPGRVGVHVGEWVRSRAAAVPGVEVHLLDLAEIALPFLDEPEQPSSGIYAHRHTQEWSRRVKALDAVILVTPEYNSSFPAPLKNALDFLSAEWRRKPVGLVGYGMTSAGTRAVAALLPVVAALGMLPAGAVQLALRQRLDLAGQLRLLEHDNDDLDELLGDLMDLTELIAVRQPVAS